jgi:hypothetical protein
LKADAVLFAESRAYLREFQLQLVFNWSIVRSCKSVSTGIAA